MATTAAVMNVDRRRAWRVAAWMPAALLVTWGVLAAAGMSFTNESRAVSTGSTTVGGTVLPELHIGGTCPGSNQSNGSIAPTAGRTLLGAACTLTFGTNNNATGALLRVENPRATAGDDTMCSTAVGAVCGATSFTDVAIGGAAAINDGEFGAQVMAAPTCVTPTWTNGNYYGIEDANAAGTGNLVCDHENLMTDASYSLEFAVNPAGAQPAVTYQGRLDFTVEAS